MSPRFFLRCWLGSISEDLDSKDQLRGGDDDDILIDGTTSHDANDLALLRLMDEWSRKNVSYAKRVAHLRSGGGLNGPFRLKAATVFHDNDVDQLFGEKGQDWFWAKKINPNKGNRDSVSTERVN